uniref:Uncharacterized protein n=1 Tax=Meloidogyne incognita TaxID=6306 RepID=A0A914L4D2_MELIC
MGKANMNKGKKINMYMSNMNKVNKDKANKLNMDMDEFGVDVVDLCMAIDVRRLLRYRYTKMKLSTRRTYVHNFLSFLAQFVLEQVNRASINKVNMDEVVGMEVTELVQTIEIDPRKFGNITFFTDL